jgi:hypothetical protein
MDDICLPHPMYNLILKKEFLWMSVYIMHLQKDNLIYWIKDFVVVCHLDPPLWMTTYKCSCQLTHKKRIFFEEKILLFFLKVKNHFNILQL